jgi:hypothetical protein
MVRTHEHSLYTVKSGFDMRVGHSLCVQSYLIEAIVHRAWDEGILAQQVVITKRAEHGFPHSVQEES